jgi:molybdopterin synthase catalytic subunit/molybdopterin converting factor small subunit
MNNVRVLLFSILRERIGKNSIGLELPEGCTVSQFKTILGETYPSLLENLSSILVAINKEYAFDNDIIPDNAELAMFPPVSGGADPPTIFSITEDELNLNDLLAQITLPSTGAACVFTGMVRGETRRGQAHQTEHLEYQAYPEMAEAKMRQVAEEIRQNWPTVEGIVIVQRIGNLKPGTPTVMIACTAAHRDTGVFEAARYGIDRLKQIVPVWKKEVGPDGSEWVEGEYIPKPGE